MHPAQTDKNELYSLWKEVFGFDDGGWIDDYFQRGFHLDTCYIRKQEGRIVSTLCAHPHRMCLENQEVRVLFIIGVITKKEDQHQGHMRALLEDFFKETSNETDLYVLQAYHPEIYTSSGFQEYYTQTIYEIEGKAIASLPITTNLNALQLYEVSTTFFNDYDGYLKRDTAWYKNLLLELAAQDYRLYGVTKHGLLQGYALGRVQADGIFHIEELQYCNTEACESLLAYAQQAYTSVQAASYVPLPHAHPIAKECSLMVKLGNKEALKNILQREITSLNDVYAPLQKPLYHYGFR